MPQKKEKATDIDRTLFEKVYLPAFIKFAEQRGLRMDTSTRSTTAALRRLKRKCGAKDILRQANSLIESSDIELAHAIEAMLQDPGALAAIASVAERKSART